jgi:hypothetical protein
MPANLPEDNQPARVQLEVLKNVSVRGNLSFRDINITTQTPSDIAPSGSSSENVDVQTWLDTELHRSRARCIVRWQGAGVGEEDAITLADDSSVGAPPPDIRLAPGRLTVLIGEMGAGKSLIVERLFQTAIQEAKESPEAAIPIFFKASQLQRDRALEQVIQEVTRDLCNLSTHCISVFIDGVDETGASNALRLLEESRLLVHMGWQITIVIASRPIPDFVTAQESIKVPLLSNGSAEALVSRLAGRHIHGLARGLTQSVQDAVRRPLFAVLLGTYLRQHNAQLPRSREQLLSDLVERSLHPLGSNVIRAKQWLERLAVASIDRGGASVPITEIAVWSERSLVAESRLVVEEAGEVRFPLPVLTEWFAAQSLAAGEPSPETLVRDSQRLERWQYPLVLVTAILPSNRVSEILIPIVENQPTIASAIINEALANQGCTLDMPSLPVLELGRQVRTAMQSWVAGLGELAPKVAPLLPDGTLPTTGVRLSQRDLEIELPEVELKQSWIDIGWHSTNENPEGVVELPPGIDGSDLLQLGWRSIYGSGAYQHPSWAWQWSHEKLIDSLSSILRERSLPVTAGHLSLEAAWYAASNLIRGSASSWMPIPLDQIDARLVNTSKSSVSSRMRHALEQLELELETARQQGLSHLSLPGSVQNFRSTGVYSHEILLAYAENTYREAVKGYEYLVDRWFPKFAPQLPLASILPAQLVGVVVPPKHASDSISLGIYWETLPYGSPSSADFSLSDRHPVPDIPRYQTAVNQMRVLRPKGLLYPSFKTFSQTPLTPHWLGDCPITEMAYQWLWEDLKKMGWVKGDLGNAGYPYWR